ncbi:MAG: DUF2270 domain-containing protein [Thermoplasmatota archaeon]
MKKPDPEDFVEQQGMSDFTSVMVNFYRGEVQRAYTWRTRMDRTTNWAILILSVLITWTFSAPGRPPELLLFSMLFLTILMFIESRRYMVYNVWDSRIRVLEENFIAKALNPEEEVTSREWMKTLAEDLKRPSFKMPLWHAISHRLRRIYVWLFYLTIILWLGKLSMHPVSSGSLEVIVSRASFAGLSGRLVVAFIFGVFIFLNIIAFAGPQFEERKGQIRVSNKTRKEWEKKM